MGSVISLGVENFEIDWGKNFVHNNHSRLFLPTDKCCVPYYYADDIVEEKPALCRSLRNVRRRLGLLGYTMNSAREAYEWSRENDHMYCTPPDVSFDQFAAAIRIIDVERIGPDEGCGYDLGEYISMHLFQDPEFNKVAELRKTSRHEGEFYENLDPYLILRLLLENEKNLDKRLLWRYADVMEEGYIEEKDLFGGLREEDKYLIITEGSSDASVLERSLQLVAPDIADFFYFIDMRENYPFTGVGNVHRFCQGLLRIRILNKILVVLDNDAAGNEVYTKLSELALPSNIKIMRLPDLQECSSFRTIGPGGVQVMDVNGAATSIEMFLDLSKVDSDPPTVRWTSFNESMSRYQGELVDKGRHLKKFFELHERKTSQYDLSRLQMLWNQIYNTCAEESA